MTRAELRQLAYSFAQADPGSVSQATVDLLLNESARAFARDVSGLRTDYSIRGTGERRYDLPRGTTGVDAVYFNDDQENPLTEGDSTNGYPLNRLRDPDFDAEADPPRYFAVEYAVPPRIWFDGEIRTGKTVTAVIHVSTVTWGTNDTDEPQEIPSAFHEAIAYRAASYIARILHEEATAELRLRDYDDLVNRYQQQRASLEPSGMALNTPPDSLWDAEPQYAFSIGAPATDSSGARITGAVTVAEIYAFLKQILGVTGNIVLDEDDQARTITLDVRVAEGANLLPADRAKVDKAVQIDGFFWDGTTLTFASADGTLYRFTPPGVTVHDEGTSIGTSHNFDFRGAGVTATRQPDGHIRVEIPGSAGSGSVLSPEAAVPAAAGHTIGEIINVGGDLYELETETDHNRLHGTAAATSDFYGVTNIPGDTAAGTWDDPGVTAEFLWAAAPDGLKTNEQAPDAKLRLPRSTFTGAPPQHLYVQVQFSDRSVTNYTLTRDPALDTGSGTGSGATGVFGWSAADTGAISEAHPPVSFTASIFSNANNTGPVEIHEAPRWKRYDDGGASPTTGRTDDQVKSLARDAVEDTTGDVAFTENNNVLAATVAPGAIDAANLDADTDAKQRAIQDAINAEAKLQQGTGITFGPRRADGSRTIGMQNPQSRAGGALDPRNTFNQLPLDPTQDYRIEAVEYFRPHVFQLTWDATTTPNNYQGSFEVREGITLEVEYTRLSAGGQYAGRFSLVRTPASTEDTLATLFPDGAINTMLLRISSSAEGVRAATELVLPISDDTSITNSLAFVSDALQADPPLLASGTDSVWVEVNFRYTSGGVVTGWQHSTPDDISTGRPNGVAIDPSTPADVWVSKFNTVDLYRSGSVVAGRRLTVPRCQGLSHNGQDLFVSTESYSGGEIRRYVNGTTYTPGASNLSWAMQAAANPGNTNRGAIATDPDNPNDLYVFFADLNIRCFTYNGSAWTRAASKDITPAQLGNPPGGILDGGSIFGGILYALTGPGTGATTNTAVVVALRLSDRTILPNSGISASDLVAGINPGGRWIPIGLSVQGALMRIADNRSTGGGIFTFRGTVTPANTYTEGHEFRTIAKAALKEAAREEHVKNISQSGNRLTVTKQPVTGAATDVDIDLPIGTLAVDELPDPNNEGEQVYVRATYTKDDGVEVQPSPFAGTVMDGRGYGTRGYYGGAITGSQNDAAIGSILGIDDFPQLVMISDTHLAIKSGSITGGINMLHIGEQSFTLIAHPSQQNQPLIGYRGEPNSDLYVIIGPGLPAGDWRGVYVTGTGGAQTPAGVTINRGLYIDTGSSWTPAGFDAPVGDAEHDFDILIREHVPGTAQTKAVAFVEDSGNASLYQATAPFDNIDSITFDGRAGQPDQNKYVVRLDTALAHGGGIPSVLRVGAFHYALTAAQAQSGGTAAFLTPVVDASERVSDSSLSKNIDIQYSDKSWANGTGGRTLIRTLDRSALQRAANDAPAVVHVPRSPTVGQRVNLLSPDTIQGYGVLRAGITASGDFAGFFSGSPQIGSLTGAPANGVSFLGSYLQAASGHYHNKTVWGRAAAETRTPRYCYINGRRYGVTQIPGTTHFWSLDGATSATIQSGRAYSVQFEYTNGDTIYADITLQPGDLTWDGAEWEETPGVVVRPTALRRDPSQELTAGRVVVVDPNNTGQFALIRGLTKLVDGPITGLSVSNIAAHRRTQFLPLPTVVAGGLDLDDYADGVFMGEVEITQGTTSGPTLGNPTVTTHREATQVTRGTLARLTVYQVAQRPPQGARLAEVGLYSSGALQGTFGVYLVRNAQNQIGYVIDYNDGPGNVGGNVSVGARMTLTYQPFLG